MAQNKIKLSVVKAAIKEADKRMNHFYLEDLGAEFALVCGFFGMKFPKSVLPDIENILGVTINFEKSCKWETKNTYLGGCAPYIGNVWEIVTKAASKSLDGAEVLQNTKFVYNKETSLYYVDGEKTSFSSFFNIKYAELFDVYPACAVFQNAPNNPAVIAVPGSENKLIGVVMPISYQSQSNAIETIRNLFRLQEQQI